jgi:hypothetical protein
MPREPQPCGAFPRLQHRAIELRETKVIGWSRAADQLVLQLDAYVHVSQGKPGIDTGTAWSQRLEFIFEAVTELQLPDHAPLWISRGEINSGEIVVERIALPCSYTSGVAISLSGDAGTISAKARSLQIRERGEPTFVERFERI